MGKFTPKEKRELFYGGVTDHKGNVRLDKLKEAEEMVKRKQEKIREGYNQLIVAKRGSALLGLKIFECHIIAVMGKQIYVKCGDQIKEIGYEVVLDYIKNTRYLERV